MDATTGHAQADQQIAAAVATEQESLSPQCRADASRLERLWRRTADGHWQMFHHQGTLTAR